MTWLPSHRVTIVRFLHIGCVCMSLVASISIILADIIGAGSTASSTLGWAGLSLWLQRTFLFPGFIGALVTGPILISERSLGFFKQPWVVVKWSVGSVLFVFSLFLLEPAAEIRGVLLQAQGQAALVHPLFVDTSRLALTFEIFLCVALCFLIFVGVRKPWRKKPRSPKTGRFVEAMVLEEVKTVRESAAPRM